MSHYEQLTCTIYFRRLVGIARGRIRAGRKLGLARLRTLHERARAMATLKMAHKGGFPRAMARL